MIEDLPESALDTCSWDEVYDRELSNFHECGDEGEIWFGKQCERRIVEWITKNVNKNWPILEFGSGNGHLLVSLAKQDYSSLKGVDYSEGAVKLGVEFARSIGFESIEFSQADILNTDSLDLEPSLVVLDKGTFDAISLGVLSQASNDDQESNDQTPSTQPRASNARILSLARRYKDSLLRTLSSDPEAIFLITSCNWTRAELEQIFSPEFGVMDEIMHPVFSFGGKTGQTVTSIAFRRRS